VTSSISWQVLPGYALKYRLPRYASSFKAVLRRQTFGVKEVPNPVDRGQKHSLAPRHYCVVADFVGLRVLQGMGQRQHIGTSGAEGHQVQFIGPESLLFCERPGAPSVLRHHQSPMTAGSDLGILELQQTGCAHFAPEDLFKGEVGHWQSWASSAAVATLQCRLMLDLVMP